MKNKTFFIVLTLFAAGILFAADRQIYRDTQGHTAGTASSNGNRTTYRDAQGRTSGTKR